MEEYKVYVVPTPIGNLKDITLRALEVLRYVDIIACEDTRHTKTLLNAYDIDKKLIAYHEFNEEDSTRGIIKYINEGRTIALVTDPGMPGISDPGHYLINTLIDNNISFTVLPGPSASITALVKSGFPSDKFVFLGFFPRKKKEQEEWIKRIKEINLTTILYESPKRIGDVLELLKERIPDRKVCVIREISKIYEESRTFYLKDYEKGSIIEKGECIFLIGPKVDDVKLEETQVLKYMDDLKDLGYSNKDIINIISKLFDIKKNKLKKISLDNK